MNARHGQVGRKPHGHRLLLSFAYRSHAHTLAVPRFAAFIVFLLIPLAAVIYLAATCYLIFHDDVLAGLMQHQADMQYAYQDRIAGLQRDAQNAGQRADSEAADFTARLRALSERQDQVENRTALVAAFADHLKQMKLPAQSDTAPAASVDPMPTAAIPAPAAGGPAAPFEGKPHPAGFDLRLQDGARPPSFPFSTSDAAPIDAGQSPAGLEKELIARYGRADSLDLALLDALENPADRLTREIRDTLAEVGLSATRFRHDEAHAASENAAGVGGPFVPLPVLSDGSPFANAAARLQSALATAQDLKSVLPHIPLKAPLPGELEVTSPFGPRIDPFLGRPALHTGVDLHGVYGAAIRATAPGRVTFAGFMGGYGNLVEIDNGNGLSTRYAHLSTIDVGEGETVGAGAIVGHIGDSGRATGPHLHYEVRIDGQPVDPERFLRAGLVLEPELTL